MIKLNKAPFVSKLTYAKGEPLDCFLGSYANGQTALLLKDATTGEPVAKATVAVDIPISLRYVVLKCWGENEGMAETLLSAGIIEGGVVALQQLGYAYGEVWKLAEVVA